MRRKLAKAMLDQGRDDRTRGFREPPSPQRSTRRVRPRPQGAAGTAAAPPRPAPPPPGPARRTPGTRARLSPPAPPAPRRPETPQLAAGARGSARAAGHSGDCSPPGGRPLGPLRLPEPQTSGVRLVSRNRRRCRANASAHRMRPQNAPAGVWLASFPRETPAPLAPGLTRVLCALCPNQVHGVPGSLRHTSYAGLVLPLSGAESKAPLNPGFPRPRQPQTSRTLDKKQESL